MEKYKAIITKRMEIEFLAKDSLDACEKTKNLIHQFGYTTGYYESVSNPPTHEEIMEAHDSILRKCENDQKSKS